MKTLSRLWFVYLLALVVCVGAVVYKVVTGDSKFAQLLVALIFAGFGLVCGFLAWRVASAEKWPKGLRWILGVVLFYHALAAPVFIVYFLNVDVSTNQDIPHKLYPHIVGFVNSLM